MIADQCLIDGCSDKPFLRGACWQCYQVMAEMIRKNTMYEEYLIEHGMLHPEGPALVEWQLRRIKEAEREKCLKR